VFYRCFYFLSRFPLYLLPSMPAGKSMPLQSGLFSGFGLSINFFGRKFKIKA